MHQRRHLLLVALVSPSLFSSPRSAPCGPASVFPRSSGSLFSCSHPTNAIYLHRRFHGYKCWTVVDIFAYRCGDGFRCESLLFPCVSARAFPPYSRSFAQLDPSYDCDMVCNALNYPFQSCTCLLHFSQLVSTYQYD